MIRLDRIIALTIYRLATENRYYWMALAAVIVFVGMLFWYQSSTDPRVYYLSSSHGANWIRDTQPFDVNSKQFKRKVRLFKKNFDVSQPIAELPIYVKAFKFFRLYLDDKLIYESSTNVSEWKNSHKIVAKNVDPGRHELVVVVMNYDGPPAVLAYSDLSSLKTNSSWSVSVDGEKWMPAALLNVPRISAISEKFPSAVREFISTLPIGVLSFLFVFIVFRYKLGDKFRFSREKLRWFLLASWVILSIDSLLVTKLMGFDMIYHVEYIEYILKNNSLPLATDGLQMFQSPLFYLVSAGFVKLSSLIFEPKTSYQLLKIIPLLCGMAMIEISYRCARLVFPERVDLQCISLVIAAMLPMNLYMSQYLGNEPLLAVLSALCILLVTRWIRDPEISLQPKQQIILGGFLGLALLAKVTAFLLIIIMLPIIAMLVFQRTQSVKPVAVAVARVVAVLCIVAGWYYLRNWLELGRPFVGGWDTSRGFTWWQDPGYRNLDNFISFGEVLVHPIYAATQGFWDAFYSTLWGDGLLGSQSTFATRPPWNYEFVLSVFVLSVFPTFGLLYGFFYPVRPKIFDFNRSLVVLFYCACVLLYLIAIIYLYFHLPVYSTVKASYSLGLVPCYAVLIAVGMEKFMNHAYQRMIATSLLLWWSIGAYTAYFSTGNAA